MRRILAGMLVLVFVVLLVSGLAAVYAYRSGEKSLKAAEAGVPQPAADLVEQERLRTEYEQRTQKTLAWQEGWVAYGGAIYEYKEDCLNLLLLGIDRTGEVSGETDLSDWSAGQADTIFLVSLDPGEGRAGIIGIPRNTMVELEIYGGDGEVTDTMYNQICLQYGYAGGGGLGLDRMAARVSELFSGLPIHGVCAIGFDALGEIADALGGIEVTVPEDTRVNGKSYGAGETLKLTRKNIVSYLQYRDYTVMGTPTVRLTRQKEFVKTAVPLVLERIKGDPLFISELYRAVTPYMNTDITLDEAVYLAAQAPNYSITDGSFYQLVGEDRRVDFEKPGNTGGFWDDLYLDGDFLRDTMMEVFYRKVVIEPGE